MDIARQLHIYYPSKPSKPLQGPVGTDVAQQASSCGPKTVRYQIVVDYDLVFIEDLDHDPSMDAQDAADETISSS